MATYTPPAGSVVHELDLRLDNHNFPPAIDLTQYDATIPILKVNLYENEVQYTIPTGGMVNIRMSKPDGKGVYNEMLGTTEDNHSVFLAVTAQMTAAAGEAIAIVEITDNGGIIGSGRMRLHIAENPVQEDQYESTDEYETLGELVKQAQASADAAKNSQTEAKKSQDAAKKSETAAAGSAQTATDQAAAAKGSAGEAANSQAAAEEAKTGADAAKQAAEDAKTAAETARDKAAGSATEAAGSANSAAESAEQAKSFSNGDAYVQKVGDTMTGPLVIRYAGDAIGNDVGHPPLVVGNPAEFPHIEIDDNEVLAKSNTTTPAILNLNTDGGLVSIGPGGIKDNGNLILVGAEQHITYADTYDNRVNAVNFYAGDKNGAGLIIGAHGRTIVGSGESQENLRKELNASGGGDNDESMHISSDSYIRLHTNCQTIADRKTYLLDKEGNFEVPSNGKFIGNLTGNADTASQLKIIGIPEGTDLDSYQTPGWYVCELDKTVKTLLNSPTTSAFALEVLKTSNLGITQRLTEYLIDDFMIFERNHYSASTGWGPWYRVYTSAYPIDGRNLLRNSHRLVSNNTYIMVDYPLTKKPEVGKTYTIQIKGELGDDRTQFVAYNSGGEVGVAYMLEKNAKGLYSQTFPWKNNSDAKTDTFVRIYQYDNNGTSTSTIEWVKLEEGPTASDWTPAPEDSIYLPGDTITINNKAYYFGIISAGSKKLYIVIDVGKKIIASSLKIASAKGYLRYCTGGYIEATSYTPIDIYALSQQHTVDIIGDDKNMLLLTLIRDEQWKIKGDTVVLSNSMISFETTELIITCE